MNNWIKIIVSVVFISTMACSIPSPGPCGAQSELDADSTPSRTAESTSPEVLPTDMGMSEFDSNQMLKYSVNPASGNVVIVFPSFISLLEKAHR